MVSAGSLSTFENPMFADGDFGMDGVANATYGLTGNTTYGLRGDALYTDPMSLRGEGAGFLGAPAMEARGDVT